MFPVTFLTWHVQIVKKGHIEAPAGVNTWARLDLQVYTAGTFGASPVRTTGKSTSPKFFISTLPVAKLSM